MVRGLDLRRKIIDEKWSKFQTHVDDPIMFWCKIANRNLMDFAGFLSWLFPEQTFVCSVHWSLLMYQCRSIVCRTFLLELNVSFFVRRTLVEMPYVIPQYVQMNCIICVVFFRQARYCWNSMIYWFMIFVLLKLCFWSISIICQCGANVVLSLKDTEQGS